MKLLSTIVIAILSTVVALTSCSKESIDGQNNASAQTEGSRTIAVSFGPQTRTALGEDGVTPKFVAGDEIMVVNGHATRICTVSVDGSGNASFTTDLTGQLMALYPATAAKVENNTITGYYVSTKQTGLFKDANIAAAMNIPEDAKSADFMNITAVFEITPLEDSEYLEVITTKQIANYIPEGSEYDTRNKIHIDIPETDRPEKFYVSIYPTELQAKHISFANGKFIKTVVENTVISPGRLYKVDENGWDTEYAEIPMTVGGVTRNYKWATRNIGAGTPQDHGDYFAWGAPEVAYNSLAEGTFTFKDTAPESYVFGVGIGEEEGSSWNSESGFSWINTPFNGGSAEYNEEAFNNCASMFENNTLNRTNDAAQCNWYGSWRMPTVEEFAALNNATYWKWNDTKKGYYVYKTETDATELSKALLFFPAAGRGNGTNLDTEEGTGNGPLGYYWSSTLSWNSTAAYALMIDSGSIAPNNTPDRYFGCTIRAISE